MAVLLREKCLESYSSPFLDVAAARAGGGLRVVGEDRVDDRLHLRDRLG